MNPYPPWLNAGDNAWQLVAATLVGLMSIPGIAILYGGIVQRKWAVNTMLMAFTGFSLVLMVWVAVGIQDEFRQPAEARPGHPEQLRQDPRHDPGSRHPRSSPDTSAQRNDAAVPVPAIHPGLLPVRLRRDHPTAVFRQCHRPHQTSKSG
jgi:hypothetical protein